MLDHGKWKGIYSDEARPPRTRRRIELNSESEPEHGVTRVVFATVCVMRTYARL